MNKHLEAIKLALIEGDELKARTAELAATRELLDTALNAPEPWNTPNVRLWLRRLDMVVGR
jgi:hypothetical protein